MRSTLRWALNTDTRLIFTIWADRREIRHPARLAMTVERLDAARNSLTDR